MAKKQKLHIKKGDTVKVICGNYKGQDGRVLLVNYDKSTAIVESMNLISKHTKPNKENPKGGIVKKEAPIHLSNLMLIDSDGNASRIGRRIEDGKLVRYSKKSGEVIK